MDVEIKAAIFGALIALIASGGGYVLSAWQHSRDTALKQKLFLAERKYELFVSYMKSVNQSWAQFKTKGEVDYSLRQQGIDAYEEMRLISSDQVQQKADAVNMYFSKLYPGYKITDDEQTKFNSAFNQLIVAAKKQFTF